MLKENQRQATKIVEVFVSGDTSELGSLIAPTYVDHQDEPPNRGQNGPQRFRAVVEAAHASGAPIVSVEDLFGEEDRVAMRLRWRWSHPAGERETLDILRFEGGLAVEHWGAAARRGGPGSSN